jgi:hypothetical protein
MYRIRQLFGLTSIWFWAAAWGYDLGCLRFQEQETEGPDRGKTDQDGSTS